MLRAANKNNSYAVQSRSQSPELQQDFTDGTAYSQLLNNLNPSQNTVLSSAILAIDVTVANRYMDLRQIIQNVAETHDSAAPLP